MEKPTQSWKQPPFGRDLSRPLRMDEVRYAGYNAEGDPDDPTQDLVAEVKAKGDADQVVSAGKIEVGELVLSSEIEGYAIRAYEKHEKKRRNKFIRKVVGVVAAAALGIGWGIHDGMQRESTPVAYIERQHPRVENIDRQRELAKITEAAKKTGNFSINEYEKRKTKAVDSVLDMGKMIFSPVFTASSTQNSFEASRYYTRNQLEAFRNQLVVKEETESDGSSRIVFGNVLSAVNVFNPVNDQEIISTVAFGIEIPQGSYDGKLTPKEVHEMLASEDARLVDVSVTGANYTFEGQYEISSDGSIARNGVKVEGVEEQEAITDIYVIVDDFFDDQVKK